MTERVLCVDDEPHILEGLKRQLRKRFVIETASDGESGLDLIRTQGPFALVVSDMRMPGMNGAQFLAQVRQQCPDTVRILLTGQADIDSAIVAINEGHIFRFLTKPCPPEVLGSTLEAGLAQYRLVIAERTLLEQTLRGSVKVLTDVLALVNPTAFGRASRLKRYARQIAKQLDLPNVWQFELAAMLSQLGCVTLPAETLEKMYKGQPLGPNEQKMVAQHPALGADLLRNIPRLEHIAGMIARQHDPTSGREDCENVQQWEEISLGAHILHVILEYDQLLSQRLSHHEAVARLQTGPDAYGIVAALQSVILDEENAVGRFITMRELSIGMILGEDIRAKTGTLVIAKGHEVTKVLLERLRSYAEKVEIAEPFRVLVPYRQP